MNTTMLGSVPGGPNPGWPGFERAKKAIMAAAALVRDDFADLFRTVRRRMSRTSS